MSSCAAVLPARGDGSGTLSLQDIPIRDPNILLYNGTYYLTGTTAGDGFLAWTSTDLVHWTAQGHIYTRNASSWAQENFWAPEYRYANGLFYIFFSANSSTLKRGTGVAVATSPLGPFHDLGTDPLTPLDWHCLDGTEFQDGNQCYLIFSHEWLDSNNGTGEIWIERITSNFTAPIGQPIFLFRSRNAPWNSGVTDGPSMLKHDGKYYLFWSSYGTAGYNVGYAVATNITGPYTQYPYPVITDDGGHSSVFNDTNGNLLIVFHQPNGGGLERAHILPLTFVKGTWFAGTSTDPTPVNEVVLPVAWVTIASIGFVVLYKRRRTMT